MNASPESACVEFGLVTVKLSVEFVFGAIAIELNTLTMAGRPSRVPVAAAVFDTFSAEVTPDAGIVLS